MREALPTQRLKCKGASMEKDKWFFFLSHLFPLCMLGGYWFHMPILFLSLFLMGALLGFTLDLFVPRDEHCNYEEVLLTAENDGRLSPWIYECASASYLVLHLVALGYGLYFVQFESPFWAWFLYVIPLSISTNFIANICHEYTHKNTKIEKAIGRFFLSLNCFNLYEYDHLYHHHNEEITCTDQDIGTARVNQSIYSYTWRMYPQMCKNSWEVQKEILHKSGASVWNPLKNPLLRWVLFSLVFVFSIPCVLGMKALLFYLVNFVLSSFLFSSTTYNQHYGLNRRKKEDGTYEPFTFMNIWASDHFITGRISLNVSHHGHHHLFNLCRYPHLKVIKLGPLLPYGYNTIVFLAFFPKLWFKIINPYVEEVFKQRDRLEKEGKL
jgi:alkane 1-monooxygenase